MDNTTHITKFDVNSVPKEYFIQDPHIKVPDKIVIFNILKYELVENYGALTYVEGAEYPRKAIPAGEIVYATNLAKEFMKQTLRNPFVLLRGINYAVYSINFFLKKCLYPYRVQPKYMCTASFCIYKMTELFLVGIGVNKQEADQFGYYMGMLFEFDDQYRYRAQDLAGACKIDLLLKNPRKEILRLMQIHKDRDHVGIGTHVKLMYIVNLLLMVLLIPKYSNLLKDIAIKYIPMMVPDEADWYWMGLKDNYHFGGQKHQDRIKKMKLPVMYEVTN